MTSLLRREPRMEHLDVLERLDRTLGEWMRAFSTPQHLAPTREWTPADLVQVDEFYEDGILVIRAELPGIDPDEDVDLTVADGLLHIQAERRQEEEREERGYVRKELRYGSFVRSLPLPEGVTEADISANYKDGMLEIRVPAPQPEPAKRIAVDKG
jgi:HSP20 family protein